MNSVVAIASIVTAAVAIIGAFLLFRLIRTMLELRKVTTGLNAALGWALGHLSAEANPPRPAAGQTPQLLP